MDLMLRVLTIGVLGFVLVNAGGAAGRTVDDSATLAARLQATESALNDLRSVVDRLVVGSQVNGQLTGSTKEDANATGDGITYVRWGRTVCGSGTGDAFILYRGFTARGYYDDNGGGVNTLCLHGEPVWGNFDDDTSDDTSSYVYGAEYSFSDLPFSTVNNGGYSLLNNDAPCVLCYAPYKSVQVMIPGSVECPVFGNWTKEYHGYLITANYDYTPTDYICVDEEPEVIEGGSLVVKSAHMHTVRVACGPLPCPPYVAGRHIPCVVCTR